MFRMSKFWLRKKNSIFEIFIKGKKVLDIGCGEGNLLKKDRDNIYGVDINKTIVEKLQKEGLKVKFGDVSDLPFEDNFFDVINCSNVIEHLFSAEAYKMFLEMERVLKKNGIIILVTPMPKTIWNTFGHIKPYPPASIRKLFREISLESFDSIPNFKIENIVYFGSWGKNKTIFTLSSLIANISCILRGSYLMVIKKNER